MSKGRKWLFTGGAGASLLGFGVCAAIECGFLKHDGAPWYFWVIGGTLALCALIAGVVLLIKAGFLEKEGLGPN